MTMAIAQFRERCPLCDQWGNRAAAGRFPIGRPTGHCLIRSCPERYLSKPFPNDAEEERLRVLREYPLGAAAKARLDRIAHLAAQICAAPTGLVSLVEADRQIFVGKSGIDVAGTPREQSFCAHAMVHDEAMVVPDARIDARFSRNPLVTGAPGIRFYAGQPLASAEGLPLGTLCVIDHEPREGLTEAQRSALVTLADVVQTVLESLRSEAGSQAEQDRSLGMVAELEQRFALLADSLPQMVWSTPPDGKPDYFNRQWCDFTGSSAETSYGGGWLGFLHPEDAPVAAQVWQQAVDRGQTYEIRYRLRRRDGVFRWVVARGLPMQDQNGKAVRWIGTCTDIHDEMETADALEILSQELSHRIKNIFAVIGGLVSLSSRNHPDAEKFARELYGRILSLGRAHAYVGGHGARSDLSAHRSLKGLLAEILTPYREAEVDRVTIHGDDIAIDERSATPLALVFHELATNSAKYGAIGNAVGTVNIELEAGDPVCLRWIERGISGAASNRTSGFGSRLIDMSITRQLGGTYETRWGANELAVTIAVPAENLNRG